MKFEQARPVIDAAVEQRNKWGKQFSLRDLAPDFLDAVVAYVRGTDAAVKELATLKARQAGAEKARAAKAAKAGK